MANDLHFAVCIGIDRYPGLPGRDLGSARRDAIAFRDWLIDADGGDLPAENVALVTVEPDDVFPSVGDARPKQGEVNRALHQFNERLSQHLAVNPEDFPRTRVYIYAAGHGIGPPTGEGAVLMADVEQGLWNSIELSLYASWYLHCGLVHEVVIFADCCREIIRGIPLPAQPPFDVCDRPSFQEGTVRFIGYASRLGDVAWEPIDPAERDQARGYFTAAILDGLRGAAADRETGEVTSASLSAYVQAAVEAATAGIGPYPQAGEMTGNLAVDVVFRSAGALRPPQREVRITLPAGFSGPVSIRSGPGPADVRARNAAAQGEWRLDLPDGFYQVVTDEAGAPAFAGNGLFAVTGSDVDVPL